MRAVFSLAAAASAILAGCGCNTGPGDVVHEFFQNLRDGRMDSAMELLSQDIHDEVLEEFEGKRIVSFTIDEVDISGDGSSATVVWNARIIDENSPDTNEGNEWELTRSDGGAWLITGI